MNSLLQSIEAENSFSKLDRKIDVWLKDHPLSSKIQDSVQIAKEDIVSFNKMFYERLFI